MSQITLAIRHAPQPDRLLRWQVTVNGAFAGGSLTAALFQLAALIALSLVRSAVLHALSVHSEAECHG